jgi:16S rRNA (guanine966-N2)-methyltransferase
VRVIAGSAKGRRLKPPRGARTRPTTDRVKEALFSSLQAELVGASVLDLFAGSGALGIEALSRGAESATFVERHAGTARLIDENLAIADVSERGTVVVADAVDALRQPPHAPFHVVVADPPYDLGDDELAVVLAALAPHLAGEAVVTVERDRRSGAPRWPASIRAERDRRYGDTTIHVGRMAAGDCGRMAAGDRGRMAAGESGRTTAAAPEEAP